MEFIVKEITKLDADDSLLTAKVVFNLYDTAGTIEVAQSITIELRIEVGSDVTIAQLEDILLRKATDQLRTTLAKCGDLTARELRIASDDLSPLIQQCA